MERQGPNVIDWDKYRAEYDAMTYADHLAFYNDVWAAHPVQQHYDGQAIAMFFAWAGARGAPPFNVLEIGGWTGDVANAMLARVSKEILSAWLNVEICSAAAANPVCADPRYSAFVPATWVWDTNIIDQARARVVVASHVVEHMPMRQVRQLVGAIDNSAADSVYIDCPLGYDPADWSGYEGSHVIEGGWADIDGLFVDLGWGIKAIINTREGQAHLFDRKAQQR